MNQPFGAGETCLLLDAKGRRYLIELSGGATFQYHSGRVAHDDLIGLQAGTYLRSSTGSRLVALRPRLADYVLTMPRGAQVVYPKDLGPIVHWGDVRPGDLVVEAGTGSGALTLALLRAVGPTGRVVSVEARSDHLAHARVVISRFLGGVPDNLTLVEGRVEEVLRDHRPDRLILDLPEPWSVATAAAERLTSDGILVSYLPTVPQLQQLADALRMTQAFLDPETFEILIREWRVAGRSVRPASTMVGHTGFITVARRTTAETRRDPAG